MFFRKFSTSTFQKINKNVINSNLVVKPSASFNGVLTNSFKCQFHSLTSVSKLNMNMSNSLLNLNFKVNKMYPIVRQSSTLKKRRAMMNKHKRKKRKKSLRFNTKVSRG